MQRRTHGVRERPSNLAIHCRIGKALCLLFWRAMVVFLLCATLGNMEVTASPHPSTLATEMHEARVSAAPIEVRSTHVSPNSWLCELYAGTVVVFLWRLYRAHANRNILQAQSRASGILEERERVARELHDTLIQSINGLFLTLQRSISNRAATDKLRIELDSALDRAGDLLDEARDRVSALRVSPVPLDLARAIAESANSLSVAESAGFRLIVTGIPQPLQQGAAEQIHGITQEALANAFAHAKAAKIEVAIAYHEKRFHVRVRDNGRGITALARDQSRGSRHFGLQGMHERAGLLDARLVISTFDGAGTEVDLDVPAASAYLASKVSSRWSRALREVARAKPTTVGRLVSFNNNGGSRRRNVKDSLMQAF
jgi:signal transduction histidine kinase